MYEDVVIKIWKPYREFIKSADKFFQVFGFRAQDKEAVEGN